MEMEVIVTHRVDNIVDEVISRADGLDMVGAELAHVLNVQENRLWYIEVGKWTEEEWLNMVEFLNMTIEDINEILRGHELIALVSEGLMKGKYKGKRYKKGDDVYALVHAIEHKYGIMTDCPDDEPLIKTLHAIMGVERTKEKYCKKKVERLRVANHLSHAEISVIMGYQRTWYYQFKTGSRFSDEHAMKFGVAFNVSPSYFLKDI